MSSEILFLLSGELREYEMSAAVRRLIGVHW